MLQWATRQGTTACLSGRTWGRHCQHLCWQAHKVQGSKDSMELPSGQCTNGAWQGLKLPCECHSTCGMHTATVSPHNRTQVCWRAVNNAKHHETRDLQPAGKAATQAGSGAQPCAPYLRVHPNSTSRRYIEAYQENLSTASSLLLPKIRQAGLDEDASSTSPLTEALNTAAPNNNCDIRSAGPVAPAGMTGPLPE